jgi:hypothetical protein
MIGNNIQGDRINTDADSSLKGLGLQKIRAVERLLDALLNNKKAIMCTIEYVDDVLQLDISRDIPEYTTEQNKSYGSPFSLNSKEIKNSMRIFLDNWLGTVEASESIQFVFYTNTSIMKESRVGVLRNLEQKLPKEPILQLLMDKRYKEALPFVKPVIEDYYIEQHKKHTDDIAPYKQLLDNMNDTKWISFLQLIEWNFGKADEQIVRVNVEERVKKLCLIYNIDVKYVSTIIAVLIDMVESRTFENDFLKRIVHVGEVKSLFLEKSLEAKVIHSLDPIHTRWDEIQCDDIRNLQDKIISVCPEFDKDELDFLSDEYADGAFEQKHHYDIRSVKAYNYRIYNVCRRLIKRKLKEHQVTFVEHEITNLIEELVLEAEKVIRDKAQTYDVAYKDTDMIKKSILILFEECYLAFDERGVLNG